MKKVMLSIMTTLMLLTILPIQARASTESNIPASVPAIPAAEARANVLITRLDNIKAMDFSGMAKAEKKGLRKEVRAIKSELRASGDGVYLSVGAIIIIVLLLILLL